MDPISKMAQQFVLAWQRFRRAERVRFFHIETDPSMYRDLGRLLRGLEMAPDNRSPYFIIQSPFVSPEQFCSAAVRKVRSDYGLVRDGFAKDGVALDELGEPEPEVPESTEEDLGRVLGHVWERVSGQHIDSLMLILLPTTLQDPEVWAATVDRLIEVLGDSKIRFAAADPTQTSLSELCNRRRKQVLSCRFLVSSETVQSYLLQTAAAAAPAAPKSSAAASDTSSEPTGYLSQEDAAAFRMMMAKAAKAAAEGNADQAIEALEEARSICRRNGLLTHEAIVVLGIANNYLAAGNSNKAVDAYFESAALAQQAPAESVSLQARLGAGSTLLRMGQYRGAAEVYELAAEDGRAASVQMMRTEALRLAGTCHNLDGRPEDAVRCWREALASSESMTPVELGHSTLEQVGEDFARFYNERGLAEQARSIQEQVARLKQTGAAAAAS